MIFKHPHIIIVGAGIVGASLTYHLSRQNMRVTLIDKATKPANDVTEKSFAWINTGHAEPETYFNLRQQAIADWHRVEDELNGQLKVDWSGALTWHESIEETERIVHDLQNFGYPVHLVNQKEISLLEPNLKVVPEQAMFANNEGAINPTLATELFIKAAQEAGADIQLGNEILSFITKGSRVTGVVTANGKFLADIVLLATGTNTTSLCKSLDLILPINVSPAILINFYNHHQFVNRIISNPYMEIRAASNTLTIAAEDYIDETIENNPQAMAQRTLAKIKEHWQGFEHISFVNVMTGKRPMPEDGLPIIGRTKHIDGLYLSVMHAGITLAPTVGRLVAEEILNEADNVLLSSYRPDRNF